MKATIPKVADTHRGSAGWYQFDGQTRLVCGGCGLDCGDLGDHTIEFDGTVKPSLLCPDCGWHVWGTLENWTP